MEKIGEIYMIEEDRYIRSNPLHYMKELSEKYGVSLDFNIVFLSGRQYYIRFWDNNKLDDRFVRGNFIYDESIGIIKRVVIVFGRGVEENGNNRSEGGA